MRRDIQIRFKGAEPADRPGTTVAFTLGYEGRDPVKVAAVANALAGFYVESRPWLQARMARLKQELSERRARFTERHPDVVQIKVEIQALERQLAADHGGSARVPVNPVPRRLAATADDRRAERPAQKEEQFRVLDPAIPPRQPLAPNRVRIILAGVIVAAGMAVAAAMLADRRDRSFHSKEELRAFTTVPLLTGIPRIVTRDDTARRVRRLWRAGAAAALGLALVVGASYVVAHDNEDLVRTFSRLGGPEQSVTR